MRWEAAQWLLSKVKWHGGIISPQTDAAGMSNDFVPFFWRPKVHIVEINAPFCAPTLAPIFETITEGIPVRCRIRPEGSAERI
jgi:hypothetical protein